jgi:hypothetical protein
MEDLGNAQKHSQDGLCALLRAAEVANSNGELIEGAVAALHNKITVLVRIAERLMQSIALLSEALSEINQACENAPSVAGDLSENDREQLGRQCAAAYTSELERRILRAALFGETLTAEGAAATSTDIELF